MFLPLNPLCDSTPPGIGAAGVWLVGAEWLTRAPGARVPVGLPDGAGEPEARPLTVQWTAAEHTHSGVKRQGSHRSEESV